MATAVDPSERIALAIETTADLSGSQAVRAELGALSRDGQRAAQQLGGGIGESVNRVPGQVRHAANALTGLTFSAIESGGGLRLMTREAGTAAYAIAELAGSARFAAAAGGIGAVVTILGTVILLLDQTEKKAKEAGAEMRKQLGDFSDLALQAQYDIVNRAYLAKLQHIATTSQFQLGREDMGRLPGETQQRDLEILAAQREAVFQEIIRRRRTEGRKAAEDEQHQEEADAKRSEELQKEMNKSYLDLYEARVNTEQIAARLKVEREFKERTDEIARLKIHEDVKTILIGEAARDRAEKLEKIHLDSAIRLNQIDEKRFRDEEEKYDRSLAHVQDVMQSALDSAVTGSESFISAASKMLLTPLVRKLEAVAVSESIDALAELAFGDLVGFARHTAVASAAIAGAQKVAQMAGLGSRGGLGTTPLSGGGFGDRNGGEGTGNITVVIQTVDPTSRAVINEVGYQLQRGGILKQPLVPGAAGSGYPTVST